MTAPLEFLRTDDPVVGETDDPNRSCSTCSYWSRWLPHTGDCMLYALQRREALLKAGDMDAYRRAWPSKSARTSSDLEVCDGWNEREGRGLSR
ncbi:MAG: hypothetical protein ACTHM0_13565 [Sphingomonas sp.]